MGPYEAFHAAADLLEQDPSRYRFLRTSIPQDPNCDLGCMWGWAGHFMGVKSRFESVYGLGCPPSFSDVQFACHGDVFQSDQDPLYKMAEAIGKNVSAIFNAADAPKIMRAYAEKYHKPVPLIVEPEPEPPLDPAYVSFKAKLLKGVAQTAAVAVAAMLFLIGVTR